MIHPAILMMLTRNRASGVICGFLKVLGRRKVLLPLFFTTSCCLSDDDLSEYKSLFHIGERVRKNVLN